jgi:hypothetical protein
MSSGTKYATLMETSGPDYESWYYFIKYDGNEEALKFLKEQLESIENDVVYEDMSKFDIDIDNLLSQEAVDQFILLELNSVMYHRRYDGKMQKIDFQFRKKDKDTKRLLKIDEMLAGGAIDKYVEDQYIPKEHEPTESDLETDDSDSESDEDESKMEYDESKIPKSFLKSNN